MDPKRVVLDISSDEEVGFDAGRGDDFDWLVNLLRDVDKPLDDSDDVVVVREVNPKQKLKSSKSTEKVVDDEDDDCVVLDGDPDNAVPTVNDSENGSDDLLIVGEKGQIACRDYPHARDQCAKFPFNSTPHNGHCDQCHCYVCDSPAPCSHWGTGGDIVDHCHATNKEEFWVNKRRSFKLGRSHPVPVPIIPYSKAVPQVNQNSSFPQWESNPVLQNQASRPTSIRPCSSQTNAVPNGPSLIRNQRSVVDMGRARFPAYLVSQKPPGTQNNIINQRHRGNVFVRNLGPQVSSSRTMFKRTNPARGSLPANRSGYSTYINPTYATRIVPQRAAPDDRTSSSWQDQLPAVDVDHANRHASIPNMGSSFANTGPSQPQAYSQHILQPNDSQGTYLHGNQSQNVVHQSFANVVGSWPEDMTSRSANPPPIENSHLLGVGPTHTPSIAEFNPLFSLAANPDPLDLFDDWILENQSVQGVPEGSVPERFNLASPDHAAAPVDTGMLYFDFETSWSSVTRA